MKKRFIADGSAKLKSPDLGCSFWAQYFKSTLSHCTWPSMGTVLQVVSGIPEYLIFIISFISPVPIAQNPSICSGSSTTLVFLLRISTPMLSVTQGPGAGEDTPCTSILQRTDTGSSISQCFQVSCLWEFLSSCLGSVRSSSASSAACVVGSLSEEAELCSSRMIKWNYQFELFEKDV